MFKTLNRLDSRALVRELATLRAGMDHLAITFGGESGNNDRAVERAEQVSAAIQRLEWALRPVVESDRI